MFIHQSSSLHDGYLNYIHSLLKLSSVLYGIGSRIVNIFTVSDTLASQMMHLHHLVVKKRTAKIFR